MRRRVAVTLALPAVWLFASTLGAQAPHAAAERRSTSWLDQYREPASRLIGEAVGSTFAWQRLAVLTDTIGNRLSGTPALDRAIEWAAEEMKRDGLENVHTESLKVPKWVRGVESAEIVEPARHAMVMLGLGDSVGTGAAPDGIQAEVLVVRSFEELDIKADRGSRVVVRLKMDAHFEPDALSANVVGEIRGREKPDEVVVVSGHLDSWDVGAGATDDGGGCIVTWEALRIMKKLNLRPRRTIRVVLWTNEENGGRGGLAYREQHRSELARHVLMLEADGGVFRPVGFGF